MTGGRVPAPISNGLIIIGYNRKLGWVHYNGRKEKKH